MTFHIANNCSIRRFDCAGLRQVQNCFVPDEDLHGRNVVCMLQLFATGKLITATQLYEAVAMSHYDIITLIITGVIVTTW